MLITIKRPSAPARTVCFDSYIYRGYDDIYSLIIDEYCSCEPDEELIITNNRGEVKRDVIYVEDIADYVDAVALGHDAPQSIAPDLPPEFRHNSRAV